MVAAGYVLPKVEQTGQTNQLKANQVQPFGNGIPEPFGGLLKRVLVHPGCALVVPRINPVVLHHDGKNCMENTLETIGSSGIQNPDAAWISKIEGWVVAGTLTFSAQLNQPDHQLIKSYFSLLNYHLNGEFDWRSVPVYWRWQDQNRCGGERLHVHFALLEYTPDWNWLAGTENQFNSKAELLRWLKSNWRHGTTMIEPHWNTWISYISRREDSMWSSCFSPPIHHLKRQAIAGEPAMYFPWYYKEEVV